MFNGTKKIILGSRKSPLARKQVEIFKKSFFEKFSNYPKDFFKEIYLSTKGDLVIDKKLSEIGNKGLFTKEIDNAQIKNKIDISIHSLKDLPYKLPDGLIIGGYLSREDYRDAIISPKNETISKIKEGSNIGTSSLRREIQLKIIRPDLKINIIRGNIQTRIKKVLNGSYDATLLAMAGLKRLEIKDKANPLNINDFIPAVGQGIIALVVRADDQTFIELADKVTDVNSKIEALSERSFLHGIDGSCQTPVGALALLQKNKILFHYFASNRDGSIYKKGKKYVSIKTCEEECYKIGKSLSKIL